MITVNELFSGIGAVRKAMQRIGIPHEIVGIAEIDKYAIKSYNAMYGPTRNYGDISNIDKLDYADFWTYGFPCQDISVAGKQAGINENTRSGLLYEVQRLLERSNECGELPKWLMLENVKNLVGKKFKSQFDEWIAWLDNLGYNTYWQVQNAKNYGIPQNRERVIAFSIRKDIDTGYEFPKGFDNGLRLKDFLEDEVPESYYISDEKVEKLLNSLSTKEYSNTVRSSGRASTDRHSWGLVSIGNVNPSPKGMNGNVYDSDWLSPTLTTNKGEGSKVAITCLTPDRIEKRQNGRRFKEDGDPMFSITTQDRHGVLQPTLIGNIYGDHCGTGFAGNVWDIESISPAIMTMQGGNRQPMILRPCRTEYGKQIRKQYEAGVVEESRHNMTTLEPRSDDITNTLTTVQKDNLLLTNYRIRKLTPMECWRLMGFDDADFYKAKSVCSNSQLYKQAGNSIVVDMLEYDFNNLFKEESNG